MVVVDYMAAIKRPFSDMKKLVIGGLLNIIPIVNFIATGYAIRAAKNTMDKKDELPEWEDIGELFMKGISSVFISIIYMIPAFIIMGAGLGPVVMSAISGEQLTAEMIMGAGAIVVIAAIVLLLTFYVLPVAIVNYIREYRVGDAFKVGEVARKAFNMDYFVAWIVMLVYGAIVSAILDVVPVVGFALAGFIIEVTGLTVYVSVLEEKKK